jgi:hypothetical protein
MLSFPKLSTGAVNPTDLKAELVYESVSNTQNTRVQKNEVERGHTSVANGLPE